MAGFVNQSELGKYYIAADVFVFPSLYETWGLVLNEAMQFGLPAVVSSGVGSDPDLVIEGRTGYGFAPGDSAALAGHLGRLVSDPALRAELGRNARAHAAGYTVAASVRGIRQALGIATEAGVLTR
jgi:glycosyltransferase involved in cell wall biosynthesis